MIAWRPKRESTRVALLSAVCGLVFLAFIGTSPFHDKGEPREALVVRDIVLNGNWLLPLRLGDQIPSKPPLFHWIGAGASLVNGAMTESTIRFPSALFATLGVFLVYYLGKRLYDADIGLTAGLILATMAGYHSLAVEARVDMTLAFFVSFPLALFYLIYRGHLQNRAWWYLFYLSAGVGVTAKGPVSLILCGLIISLFLISQKKWRVFWTFLCHPGVVVAIVAGVSWYGAAMYLGGDDFINRQVLKENLTRFFVHGEGGTGHQHPVYFFVPYLLSLGLPWTIYLPVVVWVYFKKNLRFDERAVFFGLWVAVVFIFFSLSAGKRPPYILPLLPPLALLISLSLRLIEEDAGSPSLIVKFTGWLAIGMGLAVVCLLAGRLISGDLFWFMSFFRFRLDEDVATELGLVRQAFDERIWIMLGVLAFSALCWLFAGWSFLRHRIRESVVYVAAWSLVGIGVLHGLIAPALATAQSYKDFVQTAVKHAGRDGMLVIFPEGLDVSSIVFYGGKNVKLLPEDYGTLRAQLKQSTEPVVMGERPWRDFTSRVDSSVLIIDRSHGTGPNGNAPLILVRGNGAR